MLDETSQLRYKLPAIGQGPLDTDLFRLQRVYDDWWPDTMGFLQTYRAWFPPSRACSGVVQQAGHAALDRRIGVRIPAPELQTA